MSQEVWHVERMWGIFQRLREEERMVNSRCLLQGLEAIRDVETLMERMRQLQDSLLQDEGTSPEEMESRFELEKSESLLVTPSGIRAQGLPPPYAVTAAPSVLQGLPPPPLPSRRFQAQSSDLALIPLC